MIKLAKTSLAAAMFAASIVVVAPTESVARDGGNGPRPSQAGTPASECKIQRKLEKYEIKVTALQVEYRGLESDLKKAKKGSREESRIGRKLKKVSKELDRARSKVGELFKLILDRQHEANAC